MNAESARREGKKLDKKNTASGNKGGAPEVVDASHLPFNPWLGD